VASGGRSQLRYSERVAQAAFLSGALSPGKASDAPVRSVLKTCIHEDLHRVFPEKTEREIEELTEQAFDLLTPRDRRLLIARYRRKLGI
jgi:hypothetical protein